MKKYTLSLIAFVVAVWALSQLVVFVHEISHFVVAQPFGLEGKIEFDWNWLGSEGVYFPSSHIWDARYNFLIGIAGAWISAIFLIGLWYIGKRLIPPRLSFLAFPVGVAIITLVIYELFYGLAEALIRSKILPEVSNFTGAPLSFISPALITVYLLFLDKKKRAKSWFEAFWKKDGK